LSTNIGDLLSRVGHWPALAITAVVVIVVIFWTELTSNVASAATFMPILGALAAVAGQPARELVIPAAMAASCAFMLPVGTPPNAIVYGSGRVPIRDMVRAGIRVNILGCGVIIGVTTVAVRWIW